MSFNINFTSEQLEALNAIRAGKNLFITGEAGTGKSYFLQIIKDLFYSKGLTLTASTGIAALNVGGMTLHSFASLGTGERPAEQIIKFILSGKGTQTRRRIKATKILAIDEISMISADILDKLNIIFKGVKGNNLPFGGIQLLLIGDFLQLPPVSKNDYDANYCFESYAWEEAAIEIYNFTKIFRQEDIEFINILNNARKGMITRNNLEALQTRVLKPHRNVTYLSTHNIHVNKINFDYLASIATKGHLFRAKTSGNEPYLSNLIKGLVVDQELELKIDAKVMIVTNLYYKEGIINGSIGRVTAFVEEGNKLLPQITFNNGYQKIIDYNEWSIEDYNKDGHLEIQAKVMQLPLTLAWAITIHKSQGLTIDELFCNLKQSFVAGQAYVALSRARSLEGLYLSSIESKYFFANQRVLEFLEY
ncbi:DEAD/DEAH box helicase [Rickettsiales endosymbiont of Stachyamoeba lipophora]|uniref:DEAD/DEAH box helicase n=1 Tax=Rickettsiales endosymbiont of Stachyamoeba lipophora TaxID=2486578 RepID=UPI0013DDC2D2|nr:AAA family ATPase [Rickettsiales endosymbiont of Stachyamoeba lipophora]